MKKFYEMSIHGNNVQVSIPADQDIPMCVERAFELLVGMFENEDISINSKNVLPYLKRYFFSIHSKYDHYTSNQLFISNRGNICFFDRSNGYAELVKFTYSHLTKRIDDTRVMYRWHNERPFAKISIDTYSMVDEDGMLMYDHE